MNEQPYNRRHDDALFTPDERSTWTKFVDDTPEVIVCILFVLACIAVAILTSTGPVTLGVGL